MNGPRPEFPIRNLRPAEVLVLLLLVLALPWGSCPAAQPPVATVRSYTGRWRDSTLILEVGAPVRQEGRQEYRGTIEIGGQSLPFTATDQPDGLHGSFESQGDRFQFTATLANDVLTLASDGETYRLQRAPTNPLARKSAGALVRDTPPTGAPSPVPPPTTSTAPALSPAASAEPQRPVFRLRVYSVRDEDGIGGEALSLLVPEGWRVEGGVAWRPHPALPAYVAMKISNPQGQEHLEALPTLPFVWIEGGDPLHPIGSTYFGNEVRPPVSDPVEYVRTVLLPRYRSTVPDIRVVSSEVLSEIAETIAAANQEPGVQKTFRAARVRLELTDRGQPLEEDLYCVVVLAQVPSIRTTFWGAERNYAFRAAKGKLDDATRVLQAIVTSVKPNLQWFNRYQQLVQLLVQNQMNQIRQVGELSRYIAKTSSEISEMNRRTYEERLASQDRINERFSQYIRGVDEYKNPFENRGIELPSGYKEAWVNPLGEYILSDDPNYNPNLGSNKNWQRMDRGTP